MSLSSFMTGHLEGLQEQWRRALTTLPAHDLAAQREALRSACEGRSGLSSAAVVLSLLDGEIARRGAAR